ncbi:unnamed protein product [Rotaria sordida]|uniref:NAD(P)(+)--arginine ADP-ribosyltransferase n=1 Tax=Rotaria sordida TaxID=392033 RepID=A0A815K287_9BILA|nr:unnamed protein product [Rotaria sordida]CAF1618860.1 unnamed protein product [Rotaria sordida]
MATGGEEEATAQHILRITDIVQEPLEFIAPIGGYEEMPLVTLEKAVEPLVTILPAVQSHAYVAKQRCENPADGLTQDESASIMLYTMSWRPLDKCLYCVLNDTLRSPDRQQKLEPWYLFMKLFLSALFRLPSIPTTAYRGVKLDLSERYVKGKTIVWWGFSSCTTTVDVLNSKLFLGATGTRTMFTLKCQSAKDIRKHSYYPAENEVLLMAATQFKVIGCLNQGDLHIIQLEETHPPFPLMQPVPVIISPSIDPTSSEASTTTAVVTTEAKKQTQSSKSQKDTTAVAATASAINVGTNSIMKQMSTMEIKASPNKAENV